MRLLRGGQRGIGNFLESLSIFGKIIFFVSVIITLWYLYAIANANFHYFNILFSLGISLLVTFIFEFIYQLFRNKSNLP